MANTIKTFSCSMDQDDYDAVVSAIGRRQGIRFMPDTESDKAGALLAEVCRGWMEFMDRSEPERE